MLKLAGEFTEGQLADHMAELDAHTYSWMQKLKTGEYFLPYPIRGSTTLAMVADTIIAIPFFVTRALTIDRLAIEVTAGDAGKIARLGIYADGTDCYPGALIKDYGTVSVAAVAVVAATGDQSLTKGLYWLVIVSDGTPTLRTHNPTWSPLGIVAVGFPDSYINSHYRKNAVGSAALADPFIAGATTNNASIFAVMPRLKSLD